jgi:DNA-binding response OmpR family regulator
MNNKILLCEDSPEIVTVLRIALEKKGYKVISATTPSQCMDKVDLGPYAAIIVDGRICSDVYNTKAIIQRAVRTNASEVIIAASSSERVRTKMMEDGCTHKSMSNVKTDIEQLVLKHAPLEKG